MKVSTSPYHAQSKLEERLFGTFKKECEALFKKREKAKIVFDELLQLEPGFAVDLARLALVRRHGDDCWLAPMKNPCETVAAIKEKLAELDQNGRSSSAVS